VDQSSRDANVIPRVKLNVAKNRTERSSTLMDVIEVVTICVAEVDSICTGGLDHTHRDVLIEEERHAAI
jgi:hypothetical protein